MSNDLTVIKKRCSVTMWDMRVELSRDGRERGLWIFLEDQSEGRSETYKKWLEAAINTFVEMMGYKGVEGDNIQKFSAWLSLDGALKNLADGKVRHGVLLEWPAIEQFYKAMGKAIKAGKRAERIAHREEEYRQWRMNLKKKTKAKSSPASSRSGSTKNTPRKTSPKTRRSSTKSSSTRPKK